MITPKEKEKLLQEVRSNEVQINRLRQKADDLERRNNWIMQHVAWCSNPISDDFDRTFAGIVKTEESDDYDKVKVQKPKKKS